MHNLVNNKCHENKTEATRFNSSTKGQKNTSGKYAILKRKNNNIVWWEITNITRQMTNNQSDSVYSHLNLQLEVLHPNSKVKTVWEGLMTTIKVCYFNRLAPGLAARARRRRVSLPFGRSSGLAWWLARASSNAVRTKAAGAFVCKTA